MYVPACICAATEPASDDEIPTHRPPAARRQPPVREQQDQEEQGHRQDGRDRWRTSPASRAAGSDPGAVTSP